MDECCSSLSEPFPSFLQPCVLHPFGDRTDTSIFSHCAGHSANQPLISAPQFSSTSHIFFFHLDHLVEEATLSLPHLNPCHASSSILSAWWRRRRGIWRPVGRSASAATTVLQQQRSPRQLCTRIPSADGAGCTLLPRYARNANGPNGISAAFHDGRIPWPLRASWLEQLPTLQRQRRTFTPPSF